MWDALFPPCCLACERVLIDDPASRRVRLCTRCRIGHATLPPELGELGDVSAIWSYDGPLGRTIVRLKFAGELALAGPLGRLLADDPRLSRTPAGAAVDALVPVPLHWRRRVARGFDQSEAIARFALRELARRGRAAPELVAGLRRTRPTRPQSDLDARSREANVAGAFARRRRARASLAGRHVLVLDDVTTTGATLRACLDALRRAEPASVSALALLRSL